jgi:hypothetical protein
MGRSSAEASARHKAVMRPSGVTERPTFKP